jgi:hypothetical protein
MKGTGLSPYETKQILRALAAEGVVSVFGGVPSVAKADPF